MEYVRLIDYIDRPELVLHHNSGGVVKAISYFPDKPKKNVLVVFSDYSTGWYYKSGRYSQDGECCFSLKPKSKEKVEGWRKTLLHSDGTIDEDATYYPTKEEFLKAYIGAKFLGEWKHVVYEIDEE